MMEVPVPVDASHIVEVVDFSDSTLQNILAHVEVSTEFSHFVYREAELDTILRLVTASIEQERGRDQSIAARPLDNLLQLAIDAHNFVGERNPGAAAQSLRDALQAGPWQVHAGLNPGMDGNKISEGTGRD
jgi:hypothetical protein